MLLSIFDLVRKHSTGQKVHRPHPPPALQIYLLSSFLLFALSVFYPASELITVHLPYYFLPLAHIGMVNIDLSGTNSAQLCPAQRYFIITLLLAFPDWLYLYHLRSVYWEIYCCCSSFCQVQVSIIYFHPALYSWESHSSLLSDTGGSRAISSFRWLPILYSTISQNSSNWVLNWKIGLYFPERKSITIFNFSYFSSEYSLKNLTEGNFWILEIM